MTLLDLGVRGYEEVWRLQKELVAQRHAGQISDTLILVEHPPVFTVGRRAQSSELVNSQFNSELRTENLELFVVERGGDITFHGPGQLVGYSIIDLKNRGRDVHRFLRDLEEVLIRTLRDFSLEAQRRPGLTGVWVGAKKIASIGIAVRRWVSYHGFALNVSVDLRYFRMIRPCGLDGAMMTSMSELLAEEISVAEVKPCLLKHWQEIFCGEDRALDVMPITVEY